MEPRSRLAAGGGPITIVETRVGDRGSPECSIVVRVVTMVVSRVRGRKRLAGLEVDGETIWTASGFPSESNETCDV
jgi:hypothetical protein